MGKFFESEVQLVRFATLANRERRNGASAVGFFGSRARGTQKSTSDVDLLVINDKFHYQMNEFTGRMHIPDRAKEKSQDIHIVRVSRKNLDNSPLFNGVIENIRKDIIWLVGGVESKKNEKE